MILPRILAIIGALPIAINSLGTLSRGEIIPGLILAIAGISFFFIAPIAWQLGDVFRRFAQPDLFFANGAIDIAKTRLFWMVGPQFIAVGMALAAILVLVVLLTPVTETAKFSPTEQKSTQAPPVLPLALEVPPLKGRVNDYAGILVPATVRQLEEVLKNFETAESTQIVLLTVPSLEGASLEDFSLRVVVAWKIGQKKLDNGALLLIAKNDHKLRIEVGNGLEGKLTNLVSGRIIRDIITPRFKEGNFDQGVSDGIAAMMAAVKG